MKEAIGEIIREAIRQKGLTQEEFASRMGMSHRSLAHLLNKTHVPIDQLIRASKVLNKDFINDYTKWLYENEAELHKYHQPEISEQPYVESRKDETDSISFSFTVRGPIDSMQTEIPNFLFTIKQEAERLGLSIA